MRPEGPTHWLLDGRIGWRTGRAAGIVAGRAGLRLAPRAGGPFSIGAPYGTLGGLRAPRVLALADEDVYLLDQVTAPPHILRLAPCECRFEQLPALGGETRGTRGLVRPVALAATADALYLADELPPRVLVLDRATLALRAVWDRRIAGAPIDVAAGGTGAHVLDGARGRVWRERRGRLELVVDDTNAASRWDLIAVDRDGHVYLRDHAADALDVFAPNGTPVDHVTDPEAVRDRFDVPPLSVDRGRFGLPESLRAECDGATFDLSGRRVCGAPSGTRPESWLRDGTWLSDALDSEIAGCQWHRLDVDVQLPVGSSIAIDTYADEQRRSVADVLALPPDLWETRQVLTGAMQPGAPTTTAAELLVQSRPGRYLWLRVRLRGHGHATPAVTAMRVRYPRASYLEHLPEVFSADDETRWFLERYLSIVQAEWEQIERRGHDMPGMFDPAAVPAGAPLAYLASWLGVPLEAAWSEQSRRHVLAGAPGAAARRGTLAEVREWLRLSLEAMRGGELRDVDYPQIVEGFRERAHLMLGTGASAALGHGAPLWSRSVVGRLQLSVYSRAGEARLVSTGDPQRDLFHEYAHRFRVFVPAAWVRTAEEERMVRRAIDGEKPAHSQYELCLVEPRLRVGIQSTVGVDTIVAATPELRLACVPSADAPDSLAPRGLGFDTVLAGARHGIQIGRDQRVGTTPPMT